MQNSYLILGAGKMAEAIAYDVLKYANPGRVNLVDTNSANLRTLERKLGVDIVVADVSDSSGVFNLMKEFDVAISAVPYRFNANLSQAAIDSGTHFCDLGGNDSIVKRQFSLGNLAKDKGVKIMPGCGIAPGAVSVIAKYGIDMFEGDNGVMPGYVKIRVGGLPQNPKGVLGYANVFSVNGLINECKVKTDILKDGKRVRVPAMTGLEEQIFQGGFGKLEAAYTSGGSLTLTETYVGKIKNLDYKTLRYLGHWEKMALLRWMGLFSENPQNVLGKKLVPRELLEGILEDALPKDKGDVMLVRVLVGGEGAGELGFDMIDRYNGDTGHTAMQRTTGYSASIVAQMLVNGDISDFGTLTQEGSVPADKFLGEWKKRGLVLEEYRNIR